jgi:hypothetical protein
MNEQSFSAGNRPPLSRSSVPSDAIFGPPRTYGLAADADPIVDLILHGVRTARKP